MFLVDEGMVIGAWRPCPEYALAENLSFRAVMNASSLIWSAFENRLSLTHLTHLIWHVISRSVFSIANCYIRFTYLLIYTSDEHHP